MAKRKSTDIKDSKRDEEKLKQDEATLDLPEVKDIPGQENIDVPNLKEMADTTISSADEEGLGILDSEDDASNERMGPAEEIDENDLIINEDEDEAEEALDEEDEKGEEEADELEITDDSVDPGSDVTEDEKIALERSSIDVDTPDNEALYDAQPDNTDFDGEKLNEETDFSGDDLDIPGAEEDDADEAIGEEDEENNDYSEADTE